MFQGGEHYFPFVPWPASRCAAGPSPHHFGANILFVSLYCPRRRRRRRLLSIHAFIWMPMPEEWRRRGLNLSISAHAVSPPVCICMHIFMFGDGSACRACVHVLLSDRCHFAKMFGQINKLMDGFENIEAMEQSFVPAAIICPAFSLLRIAYT